MADLYLYEDIPVLRNKLDIRDGETLDLVEAELSRANMMILYEQGLHEFTPASLCEIHRLLFRDIYEWAGKYRIINIEKRERLLGGRSVWYSNDENIPADLEDVFAQLHAQAWGELSREEFALRLARCFPKLWQVHPFREGNTRTVVMMMTMFVEHYGFYMDHELLAASAGYVRDSFVMASLDQFSEYEHLERILLDAVCAEPVLILWRRLPPIGGQSIKNTRRAGMFRSRIINGRIADVRLYINNKVTAGKVSTDALPLFLQKTECTCNAQLEVVNYSILSH